MKTHRLIHLVNNPYSPREQRAAFLAVITPFASSPREQVRLFFALLLVHLVNTLKHYQGGGGASALASAPDLELLRLQRHDDPSKPLRNRWVMRDEAKP